MATAQDAELSQIQAQNPAAFGNAPQPAAQAPAGTVPAAPADGSPEELAAIAAQNPGAIDPNAPTVVPEITVHGRKLAPQPQEDLSLPAVVGGAIYNTPGSLWNLVKGVGSAVVGALPPNFTTEKTLASLVGGAGQRAADAVGGAVGLPVPQLVNTDTADAAGKMLYDQYGTGPNFLHTLKTNPASVAADLSAVFDGGASLLAKGADVSKLSQLADLAKIAKTAANVTNPLNAVTLPLKAGALAAGAGLGITTGQGFGNVARAFDAGSVGGDTSRAFTDAMSGRNTLSDALSDAHGQLQGERNSLTQTAVNSPVSSTPLSLQPVKDALAQQNAQHFFTAPDGTMLKRSTIGDDTVRNTLGQLNSALSNPANRTPQTMGALREYLTSYRNSFDKASPDYGYVDSVRKGLGEAMLGPNPGTYYNRDAALNYAQQGIKGAQDAIASGQGVKAAVQDAADRTQIPGFFGSSGNSTDYSKGLNDGLGSQLLAAQAGGNMSSLLPSKTISRLIDGAVGLGTGVFAGHADPLTGVLTAGAAAPFASPRVVGTLSNFAGSAYGVTGKPLGALYNANRSAILGGAQLGDGISYLGVNPHYGEDTDEVSADKYLDQRLRAGR